MNKKPSLDEQIAMAKQKNKDRQQSFSKEFLPVGDITSRQIPNPRTKGGAER